MEKMLPKLHSCNVIKRYNNGKPVLSKKDIPYPAECIFNAGVVKFKNQYVMAFRNDFDYQGECKFNGCVIGIAFSPDGINWTVPSVFCRRYKAWCARRNCSYQRF